MDLGIDGRRALVLGASRGLGAASARALAGEGVRVLAASRSIQASGAVDGLITPLSVDLTDPRSVAALIEQVSATGGVDILVNNSSGPPPGPAATQTRNSWQAAFDAMAQPVFAITAALLPEMVAKGWGRVITIGSSGVAQPIANLALSNAVRSAIAGWSKTLASEVAAKGVTVNMVLPGRIDTDRVRQIDAGRAKSLDISVEEVQRASMADIPMGRYGEPDEFGAVVAFLASARASYMTGGMLLVDGGMIKGI